MSLNIKHVTEPEGKDKQFCDVCGKPAKHVIYANGSSNKLSLCDKHLRTLKAKVSYALGDIK